MERCSQSHLSSSGGVGSRSGFAGSLSGQQRPLGPQFWQDSSAAPRLMPGVRGLPPGIDHLGSSFFLDFTFLVCMIRIELDLWFSNEVPGKFGRSASGVREFLGPLGQLCFGLFDIGLRHKMHGQGFLHQRKFKLQREMPSPGSKCCWAGI